MKYPVLCIGFVFFLSCGNKICPAASQNQVEFSKSLEIVRTGQVGEVLVEEYRTAINFLSIVTGIDSRAEYSSTFGYSSNKEFEEDINMWRKWYKKNKCTLTERYVDSVFKIAMLKRK